MNKSEPKNTGLERTVWLFEHDVLEKIYNTNLNDHHKILKLNRFSASYEIQSEYDNGRADAIEMCRHVNEILKIWFIAFATCTGEHLMAKKID